MVLLEDMIEAYFDCRRKKRNTASALAYEINYEFNLLDLTRRINERSYTPGKSICFVVRRPRYREVFAAAFEDRIIHHYIGLRLTPLFEMVLGDRTFNCREGKGQLYGIRTLKDDIKACSENYTKDCYVMKLDLKAFFMSIDKRLLAKLIDDFVVRYYKGDDIEDVRFMCKTVIMHDPEKNCEKHSPEEYWKYLPKDKSLFTNGERAKELPSATFSRNNSQTICLVCWSLYSQSVECRCTEDMSTTYMPSMQIRRFYSHSFRLSEPSLPS